MGMAGLGLCTTSVDLRGNFLPECLGFAQERPAKLRWWNTRSALKVTSSLR